MDDPTWFARTSIVMVAEETDDDEEEEEKEEEEEEAELGLQEANSQECAQTDALMDASRTNALIVLLI